jgi:hypothetical protein
VSNTAEQHLLLHAYFQIIPTNDTQGKTQRSGLIIKNQTGKCKKETFIIIKNVDTRMCAETKSVCMWDVKQPGNHCSISG